MADDDRSRANRAGDLLADALDRGPAALGTIDLVVDGEHLVIGREDLRALIRLARSAAGRPAQDEAEMSLDQVAKFLTLSRSAVRHLVETGRLTVRLDDGAPRFSRQEVSTYRSTMVERRRQVLGRLPDGTE